MSKLMNLKTALALASHLTLIIALSGCTQKRGSTDGATSISIRMPDARGKLSAMSGFDFSRACFAALVVMPEKLPPPVSCEARGLFQGFVGQGGEMLFSVDRGTGRQLEIYAYQAESTGSCVAQAGFGAIPRDRIVRVGKYGPFDTTTPEMAINIQLEAPASTSVNVATQGVVDSSCLPKPTAGARTGTIVLNHQRLTGGAFVIEGAVSATNNEKKLTGGQYQLHLSRRPD
jgi:hypothetical protein